MGGAEEADIGAEDGEEAWRLGQRKHMPLLRDRRVSVKAGRAARAVIPAGQHLECHLQGFAKVGRVAKANPWKQAREKHHHFLTLLASVSVIILALAMM